MKSNTEIVGELSKQINIGKCSSVAFAVLARKDLEIKKAMGQLKSDLWWNLPLKLTSSDIADDVKRQINALVDKAFPTED